MHERDADLERLQDLLDASYATAGPHLRSIITPDRRMAAQRVVEVLTGVCVLAVATVTGDGRPLVSPVDGLFYRGAFWFGSSPDSVRFRHLRARPQVSATFTVGETIAVTVHGRAVEVDLSHPAQQGFTRYCREVYGPEWERWAAGSSYARIAPDRLYALEFVVDAIG